MAEGNRAPAPVEGEALRLLLRVMLLSVVCGLVALGLAHGSGLAAAVGIGALVFLASFAAGSFLGFLFGVPRVLSREPAAPAAQIDQGRAVGSDGVVAEAGVGNAAATSRSDARLLQSNTNMERISDWLTTLLVGAGLVELHNLNDGLVMFRQYLAETARVFPAAAGGAGPTAGAIPAVGPLLLVFGVASGFLYMYLNTRLVLIRVFQSIEEMLSRGEVLPPSGQRAVKAFVDGGELGASFVGQQFASKRGVTVEDALTLMFDLLYRSAPQRVIDLGGQLSGTEATRRADY